MLSVDLFSRLNMILKAYLYANRWWQCTVRWPAEGGSYSCTGRQAGRGVMTARTVGFKGKGEGSRQAGSKPNV
jgi:hypothetical protein